MGTGQPAYNTNLISSWLSAPDGAVGKLEQGAKVANIGYAHGAPTILVGQAFPASTFVGSDYHAGSIEAALAGAEAGVADRVTFEVAPASSYSGDEYCLVTMFDGPPRHLRDDAQPAAAFADRSK